MVGLSWELNPPKSIVVFRKEVTVITKNLFTLALRWMKHLIYSMT